MGPCLATHNFVSFIGVVILINVGLLYTVFFIERTANQSDPLRMDGKFTGKHSTSFEFTTVNKVELIIEKSWAGSAPRL